MATNIIVLTPNGRRQNVKVTPNTTILQIIEEACTKHGFKPEEYDIKHHRKVLDTTSNIRFSGLPNNALLELTPATVARVESEVTLGLQMEDGQRLMGSFKPSDSIWDVLHKLAPYELDVGRNTVVIYMRQEIFGAASFKSTSLKSLGLTGGRAMFRIIHKTPEELKQQANISAPLPTKPVEEKPYVRQFQPVETPKPLPMPVQEKIEPKVAPVVAPEPTPDPVEPKRKQIAQPEVNIVNMIKKEKRKQTDGIKTKNITKTEVPRQEANKHENEDCVFLGERSAMLFSLETAQAVRSDDLPDDFFELSITDVKRLFRDIKKRRIEMESSPLMTSAMKNLEESKKQLRNLNHYKKAVIRVQFPTRLVLQGVFKPSESVEDVKNFVKEYLEDKSTMFYLFTTPPKTVLSDNSKLIEIDCVPGALLYFGCEDKRDNYLKDEILDKLTSTSLASVAATRVREESKRVIQNEPDDVNINDLLVPDNSVNAGASTSADPSTTYDYKKPVQTPPEKVPKWFKPTK